jgi:hypothetical protein
MARPISLTSWNLLLILLLLFPASVAWGYRPFVSTDAAVADVKEIEIELGYFNWQRERQENTFGVPSLVINYGLVPSLELVGEFALEEPVHGTVRLADPEVSLKGIIRDGFLQGKSGISLAFEAGLLLPSTGKQEKRLGFEALGILSGQLYGLNYHLNLGGGVDRSQSHPFMLWGMIVELPISETIRLVGEINGEAARETSADSSALIGFIWNAPLPNLALDAGIRRGISRTAADWMVTAGLTFSFSPATYFHN